MHLLVSKYIGQQAGLSVLGSMSDYLNFSSSFYQSYVYTITKGHLIALADQHIFPIPVYTIMYK